MADSTESSQQSVMFLPKKAFGLLHVWCNLFPDKEKNKIIYEEMHRSIKNKDFSLLTPTEQNVLKELLSTKVVTTGNIYEYFLNCDSIKVKPNIFDKAKKIFSKENYDDYTKISQKYSKGTQETAAQDLRIDGFHIAEEIYRFLDEYNFISADELLFKNPELINEDLYEQSKAEYIQKLFNERFLISGKPFELDTEQAQAIATFGDNILVLTRFGTGSMRMLLGKILFLLYVEQIKASEICLLAFDPTLPEKINQQFNSKTSAKLFNNDLKSEDKQLLTFDKLSRELTNFKGKVLENEKFDFLKILVDDLFNTKNKFAEDCIEFFKQTPLGLQKKDFTKVTDFFSYKRNSEFQTLKGENVDSKGDKWIADYLYQHGINYVYKKNYNVGLLNVENVIHGSFLKSGPSQIVMSFYLPDYKTVWAHWIINEEEQDFSVKQDINYIFGQKWEEYRKQLRWIREFWKDWRKKFLSESNGREEKEMYEINTMIETSPVDTNEGQTEFNKKIADILSKSGIKVIETEQKIIYNEVWKRESVNFISLMTSFVDQYQQVFMYDHPSFKNLFIEYKDNPRTLNFLQLGQIVLENYEEQLGLDKKISPLKKYQDIQIDYNQMVALTIHKIQHDKENKQIKNLKWLIIPEFQNYSNLIHKLVNLIRKLNPTIKIFAIGDNWQSVDSFWGTNVDYIENFDKYFGHSNTKYLTVNYRSQKEFVAKSNLFMLRNRFSGETTKANNEKYSKAVIFVDVKDQKSQHENKEEEVKIDQFIKLKYQTIADIKENNYIESISNYLRACLRIASLNKGQKLLLLHHGNEFFNQHISSFLNIYIECLVELGYFHLKEEAVENIIISGIHNLKNTQAENIVFLDVNRAVLPITHPDYELFIPFGQTMQMKQEEQKRLFYVALTKAQNKLYLLYEEDKKSEYLKLITPIAFKDIH